MEDQTPTVYLCWKGVEEWKSKNVKNQKKYAEIKITEVSWLELVQRLLLSFLNHDLSRRELKLN